jgi:hypothetical protein
MAVDSGVDFLKFFDRNVSTQEATSNPFQPYVNEKSMIWTVEAMADSNGSLNIFCPGGHGQMVLVNKPMSWGKGKMYICPKIHEMNQAFEINLTCLDVTQAIDEKLKRIDVSELKSACKLAVDWRAMWVFSCLHKCGPDGLFKKQLTIEIPDPISPCNCTMKTLIGAGQDDKTGVILPSCVLGLKRNRKGSSFVEAMTFLGQPTVLCNLGMKKSMEEKRKKIPREDHNSDYCVQTYSDLMNYPHNEEVFRSAMEARSILKIKPTLDNVFAKCGLYLKAECDMLIKMAKDGSEVDSTKKKTKKRSKTAENEDDSDDDVEDDESDDSTSDESDDDDDSSIDYKKRGIKRSERKNFKKMTSGQRCIDNSDGKKSKKSSRKSFRFGK